MPIKRPDWLKDVPQQRTVVRRIPAQQQQYPQFQGANTAPINPSGTFTGAGVDGTIQPGKYAGMVHEGEAVIPANAAQAIPPHIFNALVQKASDGTLDINALGSVLGQPAMRGYQTGTYGAGREDDSNYVAQQSSPQPAVDRGRDRGVPTYGTPVQTSTATTPQPTVQAKEYELPKLSALKVAPIQTTTIQAPDPVETVSQTPLQTAPTVQAKEFELPKLEALKVAPIDTSTDTSTATAQQTPTNTLAQENVRTGLQNLRDQMNGMTESDKRIANYYLANTDANNASNIQVLSNLISADPNMSEAGKTMAIAGLIRDASSSRATITQGLAQNAITRASDATDKAISTGQQVRQYEDVTLPQAQQTMQMNEQTMKSNDLSYRASLSQQINDRISMLMTQSNLTPEQVASDSEIQRLMGEFYGGSATSEMISSEIGTRVAAYNDQNKAQFVTNAETMIGDAFDTGKTIDEITSNEAIRRNIAGYLEAYSGEPASAQDITDEITRRFNEISMSDLDRAYSNIVESGNVDAYKGVAGFESDLKKTIRDLQLNGIMDENGNIVSDADVDWPWENPETYFKYNDWNGNEIDDANAVATNPITVVSGNGTTYKNSNGQAVTNADATAVWDSLSSSEQYKYVNDDGTIDVEKFMNAKFRATTTATGDTIPVTTSEEYESKIATDEDYAASLGDEIDKFISSATVPEELRDTYGDVVPAGNFIYYDEYGNVKIESFTEGNLGYIWQQLSDKYNNGTPLTETQFRSIWKEGKDWRIDSNGTITNLDTPGESTGLKDAVTTLLSLKTDGTSSGTLEQAKAISAEWDNISSENKASGDNYLESINTTRYYTSGANRWGLTDEAIKWATENEGKLYKAKNGKLYIVGGMWNPSGKTKNRGATGYIILYDYETGEQVKYSSDPGGGGAERLLTGTGYEY